MDRSSSLHRLTMTVLGTRRWIAANCRLPRCCIVCGCVTCQPLALCDDCCSDLPWFSSDDRFCQHCGISLSAADSTSSCGKCLQQPPAFDSCNTVFPYRTPIRELLQRFKFHAGLNEGAALGTLLANRFAEFYRSTSLPRLIIPVPLHHRRLRERGFNQALELARPIVQRCGIECSRQQLRRQRYTEPQYSLKLRQRQGNLANAFALAEPLPVHCLTHVAIVDDVVTTGATVSALARTLRLQGAQRIDVWAVARTEMGKL